MDETKSTTDTHAPDAAAYEPPKVERVLTSDDLVREVQYAGVASVDEIVGG